MLSSREDQLELSSPPTPATPPVEEPSLVLRVGEVGQGGFWARGPLSSQGLRSRQGVVHCWPGAASPPGFQGSPTQGGVVVAPGWEGAGAPTAQEGPRR